MKTRKHTNTVTVVLLAALCLLLQSCIVGTGRRIDPRDRKTFTAEDVMQFDNVDIDTAAEYCGLIAGNSLWVHVIQGDTLSIRAEGPEEIMRELRIEEYTFDGDSAGGKKYLKIDIPKENRFLNGYMDVYVTMPKIEYLEGNDNTTIFLDSPLSSERLSIAGSGGLEINGGTITCSGAFTLDVQGAMTLRAGRISARTVNLAMQGAGDVDIDTMTCESLIFIAGGASDVDLGRLTASHAQAVMEGACDADINFDNSGTARLKVNGACSVTLTGTLKDLDIDSQGASFINRSEVKILGK